MAQILGLSATGELIISLPPSADTRDVMADAVVAQLRRSVDSLASASQRKQRVAARDAVKEILRIAHIYDEVLASSDSACDEPASESASTESQQTLGLVRYAHKEFEESLGFEVEAGHRTTGARHANEGRKDAADLDSDFAQSSTADSDITAVTPELSTSDNQDYVHWTARIRALKGITQQPTPPPDMTREPIRSRDTTTHTLQSTSLTDTKEVPEYRPGITQSSTNDAKDQAAGPGKQQPMQYPPICMGMIALAPGSRDPADQDDDSPRMPDGTHPSGWWSSEAITRTRSRASGAGPVDLYKPDEPVTTRQYATTGELAVWVWVPPEQRLHVWDYNQVSARSARLSLKDGQKPHCTEARTNELSHIYLQFACGRDKDDFMHSSRDLLNIGYQIVTDVYQIIINIATTAAYDDFKKSLASASGRRDIAREIIAENKPRVGTSDGGFRILDIDWSGKTKNGKKRGVDNPILGTIVLTLTSHAAANHLLLNKLRLRGLAHATRIHAPRVTLLQCLRCGRLGHHQDVCEEGKPRCLRCASRRHTREQCADGTTPRCILCDGEHISTAFDCNVKHRVRRVAERKLPPFAHCRQDDVSKPMLFSNRSRLH